MADFVVVGGVPIKVSPSSGKADWNDAVDRRRAFDNTYRASATGGAARDWHFSTPPITRAVAGTYRAVLSQVQAQMCSGEGLELPTMCCAELIGETPVKGAASNYVSLDFALHESASKRLLLKYAPGDTITGESFARSTTATYMDANFAVRYAAINVKRDNHFPPSGVRSLLLEDARTNLIIRSEAFDNAAWTKSTGGAGSLPVVTADNGLAPDGFVSAEKVVFVAPAAGDQSVLSQSPTVVNATQYSATIFVKAFAAGDVGKVLVFRQVGSSAYTLLTLTAAWQRLGNTETSISTAGLLEIGLRPNQGGSTGTVSVFLWGAQLEAGAFSSSYIPTVASSVLRTADSYSLPFTTPPQEMTVYAKFVEGGTILVPSARVSEITSAADGNPRLILYNTGSVYGFYHDTVASNTLSQLAVAPVFGNTVELNGRLFGDGSDDITQSINGAASTSGAQSPPIGFATGWAAQLVWLNSGGTAGAYGFTAIQSLKIVAGSRSLAEMRAA